MEIRIDNTRYFFPEEHFYKLYAAFREEWWIREMKEEYRAVLDSSDKGEMVCDLHPMFFEQIAECILTHYDCDLDTNATNEAIYAAASDVYKNFCVYNAEKWVCMDGQTSQYLKWLGGDRFEVYQCRSDVGDLGRVMHGEVRISDWKADIEKVVRSLGYDTGTMLYGKEKERSLHLIAARIFEMFCLDENSKCITSGTHEFCCGFIEGRVDQ